MNNVHMRFSPLWNIIHFWLVKNISVGIPTYAGVKTGSYGWSRDTNQFSCQPTEIIFQNLPQLRRGRSGLVDGQANWEHRHVRPGQGHRVLHEVQLIASVLGKAEAGLPQGEADTEKEDDAVEEPVGRGEWLPPAAAEPEPSPEQPLGQPEVGF